MSACLVCIRMGGPISVSSELEEGGSKTMIVCISLFTPARRAKGSRSYLVDVSSQLLQPVHARVTGELPLASH